MTQLRMRTLRRLFHNKKMWDERGLVKANSLKAFVRANAKNLGKGIETMSSKAEHLLL